MENNIKLGLNIALLVFIFFGVFWGFIRGLRRTTSRGLFLVITSIIVLFVTIPITNVLLKIEVNTYLTYGENVLQGKHSVSQIIEFFVESSLGQDFASKNPEFVSIITSIPLIFINSLVFLLLFWICKYLLFPLDCLFYKLILAPKRPKEVMNFTPFDDDDYINKLEVIPNNNCSTESNSQVESNETSNSDFDGRFIKKDPEPERLQHVVPIDVTQNFKNNSSKANKVKKQKIKYKKHRVLGALVGAGVGLVVMLNTMLPVYGLINSLEKASTMTIKNISSKETSLAIETNGVTEDVLSAYKNSLLRSVSKYTGLEGLGLAEFDFITTQKIDGKSFTLRKDITALVDTIQKVDNIVGQYKTFTADGNLSTITKDQISTLIESMKDVFASAKQVGIIDCVSSYIIPVACSLTLNNNNNISNNENINGLIIDTLEALAESKNIEVISEIDKLLDLAEYLNSQNVLVRVLKNDFSNPVDFINSLDDDFGTQFINKTFDLQTFKITMPYLFNIGLNYIDQSLGFGYTNNEVTSETIKVSLSSLLDNLIKLARTIDTKSNILLTTKSLTPLGTLLETVRSSGIINSETYKNLLNYATDQLKNIVTDLLPIEFKDYATLELLPNIKKVDNWQHEMSVIQSAINKLRNVNNGILGEVVENEVFRQGTNIQINIKEEVLVNLGDTLDLLESTCLFGATTQNGEHTISGTISLFDNILNYAKTNLLTNDDMEKLASVIDEIRVNLINSKHVYNSENAFWHNELLCVSPLIVEVYNLLDSGNFKITNKLGICLDKAKEGTMLGNGVTASLMKASLEIVEESILPANYEYNDGSNILIPQTLDDNIYELFADIKTNLQLQSIRTAIKNNSQFWTNEIGSYIALKNVADQASTLTDISSAIDMASDLDRVYESCTIPRLSLNKIIAKAIQECKTASPSTNLDQQINNTIDNISDKLTQEQILEHDLTDFWQIELSHIQTLTNITYSKDELDTIGVTLDNIVDGYTDATENIVRASYLISESDLRNILANALGDIQSDMLSSFDAQIKTPINTAINSIRNNINDYTNIPNISFAFELGKLKTLSNIQISADVFEYPSSSDPELTEGQLTSNKTCLINLGTTIGSIAFNYGYNSQTNCYNYTSDNNSQVITRNIINTMMTELFDTAKITKSEGELLTTTETAFNNLINNIKTQITYHNTHDSIISWKRELGYISTLTKLNSNTTFTTTNVATEIGKNLDAIAFVYNNENGTKNYSDVIFTEITTSSNKCIAIPEEGNSLFITRIALQTALKDFLSTAKRTTEESEVGTTQEDENNIVNDIINNTTNTIATTNETLNNINYYSNCETALTDLNSIETDIESLNQTFDVNSNTLDGANIDTILDSLQSKAICGILITRRVASLILKNIVIPTELSVTITGAYYNNLTSYLESNISNSITTPENYLTSDAETDKLNTSTYSNPFNTLVSSVPSL